MNTFAEIILVERFRKVSYYTISINKDTSLFRKFVEKHSVENNEKLQHIMSWIRKIGDKVGAYEQYFRNEAKYGDARALPPAGIDWDPVYVEYKEGSDSEENTPNNLRLYCLRANSSVVFLFNGDVKTANTSQECENVRPHFEMANRLSRLLDKAFVAKDIRWSENNADIEIDEDFILELD